MKKYLKMSDYFITGTFSADYGDVHSVIKYKPSVNGLTSRAAHYAVEHAINSHDELVTEVERLRGSLTQCVNALYIAHKFCGNHTADECGDEIAIPISDALVAASKIVSE
ncbi:MAG: hypothetical protein ACRCXB_07625 [Aeromonadaceae bacterium]